MTTTLPYQHHSDTSFQAAATYSSAATDRARVLAALKEAGGNGMTDEEIQMATGIPGSTERPRRIKLCEDGLVFAGPRKRITRSGRTATVWEVA